MLALVSFLALVLYALVVSQPFFYLFALGDASTALSATAYIELRHQINRAIAPRLIRLYLATLVVTVALAAVSFANGAGSLAGGATIAALCLVGDAVLAVKRNVPINAVMDSWTTTHYPDDWASHRARWNEAFAIRQIVLSAGFLALVFGLVAGR